MPIRLRLALAFAMAAAALFALGGWLFASGLSSAQLKTIDSQLAAQLAQAGRSLPAARRQAGHDRADGGNPRDQQALHALSMRRGGRSRAVR